MRTIALALLLCINLQGCALLLTGAAGYTIAKQSAQQKEIDEIKRQQETKP